MTGFPSTEWNKSDIKSCNYNDTNYSLIDIADCHFVNDLSNDAFISSIRPIRPEN